MRQRYGALTAGEASDGWFQSKWRRPAGNFGMVDDRDATPLPKPEVSNESVGIKEPSAESQRQRGAARRTTVRQPLAPPVEPPSDTAEVPGATNSDPAPDAVFEGESSGLGEYLGSFSVTCYALEGTTASGEAVHEGGVAVDRRLIAFGTRLFIEGVGWRIANDTGGSVRGHRLDIWLPSVDDCVAFGRRTLDVYRG